jgi:hypothetical protein
MLSAGKRGDRPEKTRTEVSMNAIMLKRAAAAAALVLLTGAPALAQGPIMSTEVTETTPVLVSINGGKAEHTGLIGIGDVTVHPGRNTLTVRWAGPVKRIAFRITTPTTPNHAKDVLVVRLDATRDATLRRAGSRTYTFTVPR